MQSSTNDSNISIIHKYLVQRGVYIKKKCLRELFISHPSFPSLTSINDIFLDLGIPSNTYIKTYRSEYDCPLLVRLSKGNCSSLAIVRKVGYRGIYLMLSNGKNILIPESTFLKIWDRNILKVTVKISLREKVKHYLPKIGIGLLLFACSLQLIMAYISASKPAIILTAILSLGLLMMISIKMYLYTYNEMSRKVEELSKIKYNSGQLKAFIGQSLPIEIADKLKLIRVGNQTAANELVLILDIEDESSAPACKLVKEWLQRNVTFKISIVFINSLKDEKEKLVVQTINNVSSFECISPILEEWYQSKFLRYVNFDKSLQYTEDDLIGLKSKIEETSACQCYINGYLVRYPYQLKDLRYLIEEL